MNEKKNIDNQKNVEQKTGGVVKAGNTSEISISQTEEKNISGSAGKNEKTGGSGGPGGTPKKKKKHIFLWIASALTAIILLAYFGGAIYFQTHFLPNTIINGIECSYRTSEEAAELLSTKSQEYQLMVNDREGSPAGVVTAPEIELRLIDVSGGASMLLDQQNALKWIFAFRDLSSENLIFEVEFDKDKLADLIDAWEVMDSRKAKAPENAYISEYSTKLKGYEIIPEKEGTLLDRAKVLAAMEAAVLAQETALNLGEKECYKTAEISADDANLVSKLETMNKWTKTEITYDWNGEKVVLDGDTIQEWIVEESGRLSLDEEAVEEFIAGNAKENDTYGKKRKFTTSLGEELTLPSGAFGWKTDRKAEKEALTELIREGAVTEREPEYSSRGAKKGKEDIGNSYVECDLTNQHLYLYQDGNLVLESDFVSGNMSISGRMTPPGVFGLTYKTRNAVLRGEDYETPVKYWMPFNGNVGMHDASWRRSFGGDIFLTGGSHGCVNLPPSMAAQIYEYVSTGFPVICYYY